MSGYETANLVSLLGGGILSVLPWLALGAAIVLLPARPRNTRTALILVGGYVAFRLLMMLFGITLAFGDAPYWTYTLYAVLGALECLAPTVAIAAWLVARMRPGVAFALLPITLLTVGLWWLSRFIGLHSSYNALHPVRFLVDALTIGILVGIAWLARVIAKHKALAPTPAERAAVFAAQQHAARVAYVQQWEAAYAAAHGGQAPPPGTMPPPPGL